MLAGGLWDGEATPQIDLPRGRRDSRSLTKARCDSSGCTVGSTPRRLSVVRIDPVVFLSDPTEWDSTCAEADGIRLRSNEEVLPRPGEPAGVLMVTHPTIGPITSAEIPKNREQAALLCRGSVPDDDFTRLILSLVPIHHRYNRV